MTTRTASRRLIPAFVLGMAACTAGSPVARPPETLAGLPLQRQVDGQAALEAIAALHRSGDLGLDSAWIARYGMDTSSALLYVGIARDPDRAASLVANMREALSKRPSPFRYAGQHQVGDRTVHALRGQGQYHYVFADGPRAVWLSAHAVVARAALAQTLGLAPDNPALDAVAAVPLSDPEPTVLRSLGPMVRRLVDVGALDPGRLGASLARSGHPLTQDQRRVIHGQEVAMRLEPENGAFLLNTLWALGLTNRNPILTAGPMAARGGRMDRFASTGGWRLGRRPVTEFYATIDLIPLGGERQIRAERVSRAVYRPCCDNSTFFPDCNHGMAMLALLTLLTAQGADDAALLTAAREANAIWFPRQSAHVDAFLAAHGDPGAAAAVGPNLFSATGHRLLRATLAGGGPTGSASAMPRC